MNAKARANGAVESSTDNALERDRRETGRKVEF